jgi:hypothetical protein
MNATRKALSAAGFVDCMRTLDRFVVKAVEFVYGAYMDKAQMRLAPTRPIRHRTVGR